MATHYIQKDKDMRMPKNSKVMVKTQTHAHDETCTHKHTSARTQHVHTQAQISTRTHAHDKTCTQTQISTRTHARTHTHARMHARTR